MIVQVSGTTLGSISLVPMTHHPVITIDAQDSDGNKVVLHFVKVEE